MSRFAERRSRLATRAFCAMIRHGAGTYKIRLIALLIPKEIPDGGELRISRSALRRVADDADPQRVEALLKRVDALAGVNAWVTAFAVEFGLARGTPAFAERHLERYVAEVSNRGLRTPDRYLALLASMQINSGRSGDALKTLSNFRPTAHSAGGDADRSEIELLTASASTCDEQRWLRSLNQFMTGFGLSEIRLSPGNVFSKFSRLCADGSSRKTQSRSHRVTVIVSCFNAEKFVETSLRSLCDQTYANLEIIAIDDSSTDNTWELLRAFARNEGRVRLLRNRKNVGTYVSRNRAFLASTGDFVTTQDSDDWSHPERIARQLSLLESTANAVASYCGGLRMWEDGRFEVHQKGHVVRNLCYPSLMYRKDAVLGRTGYWDCVRVEADAEYYRRVVHLFGSDAVLCSTEPMMIQLRRENSLTTHPDTNNLRSLETGDRQAYREAAARFRRTLNSADARYDFENWTRPFPAPEAIVVSEDLVREASTWD